MKNSKFDFADIGQGLKQMSLFLKQIATVNMGIGKIKISKRWAHLCMISLISVLSLFVDFYLLTDKLFNIS